MENNLESTILNSETHQKYPSKSIWFYITTYRQIRNNYSYIDSVFSEIIDVLIKSNTSNPFPSSEFSNGIYEFFFKKFIKNQQSPKSIFYLFFGLKPKLREYDVDLVIDLFLKESLDNQSLFYRLFSSSYLCNRELVLNNLFDRFVKSENRNFNIIDKLLRLL
ncbi:hypothetical protein ACTFIT_010201 [Dictyostelium discoideum]